LATAYELSFKDISVDCVIFLDFIEHFNDPEKAFHEIRRVLERDSLLLLSIPNDATFKLARIIALKIREAFKERGHAKKWKPELIEDELRRRGFTIVASADLSFHLWRSSLHHVIAARKGLED